MRFDLRYGDGSLPLELSGRLTVDTLLPRTVEGHIDDKHTIVESLEKPIDSSPFSQIASRASSAAIVVNGEQDTDLIPILLNAVLEYLQASLSSQTDISVIYPVEPQDTVTQSDILKKLGGPEKDIYQLVLHDSRVDEDLCFVGETPTHCTPVHVNKVFLDADVKIGIGTIRSDVFVGATGGRMSVLPYSSGVKSISRNSKLRATHSVGPFVTDSAVCIDLEEASRLANLDFILNAIPDWESNLNSIVSGEPYAAWKNGVLVAKKMTETIFHHKADIAIVSAGGSFSDLTLYDAVDALYAGRAATEHGGVIVLVAECAKGPGPDGFVRGVSECTSSDEVSVLAEIGFEIGMEKARFFWEILKSRKVIICSRVRESFIVEKFHCSAVKDPQEGYELARSMIVSKPRLAIIPNGSRILPIMKNK
ncbi:MAG: lactate racemase domain-containing protein [Candidatus Thorarchaeota archaeon]